MEEVTKTVEHNGKVIAMRHETSISENNLKHWGIHEALKEFVQNNVYAYSILGDKTHITYDGKMAVIHNTPSGFTKGKLLIGESDQADVVGAPGQYGEGMKVAMAIARRLDRACWIETNGFRVRPELLPSSLDPSVKVLTYFIDDTEDNNGTTFHVECTEAELMAAMESFAMFNGVDMEDTKHDAILEIDDEDAQYKGGQLYVNGVLVSKVNSILSYNFTNPELMNRDRTTVNMDRVKDQVVQLLYRITDSDMAREVLVGILQDDTFLEAQAGIGYSVLDPNTWREACTEAFGKKLAIATGGEMDTKARYHKFTLLTSVPSQWRGFFRAVLNIPYTNELEEIAEKPKNVHKKPSADENQTLGWAKRLVNLYYGDYGTVKISEKVYDQFNNEALGLYDPKTDTIWLARALLSSKEETFKTLLHETIHRVSGALDNTWQFTKEWEQAAWNILNRGRQQR